MPVDIGPLQSCDLGHACAGKRAESDSRSPEEISAVDEAAERGGRQDVLLDHAGLAVGHR